MTDPDLARRFQEAAESTWPGRPALATITVIAGCHGVPVLLWEVELADTCERARRHLPAACDPSPEAVVRDLRSAMQMHAHLRMHGRMG